MKITKTSRYTGRSNTMEVNITEDDYSCIKNGGNVDVCAPHVTYEEREFLLTGVTPEEQDAMDNELDKLDSDFDEDEDEWN